MEGIEPGTAIYRNHDHVFLSHLDKSHPRRRIAVRLTLEETADGFSLTATDEDGNVATGHLACDKVKAEKPEQALANAGRQLRKMGDTEFACTDLNVVWQEARFLPFSALNALRRDALEHLVAERARNRPVPKPVLRPTAEKNSVPYPEQRLTYRGNVLNQQAAAFYRRHGVTEIEPAPESGLDMRGRAVMRTRYCIKHQLGVCARWKDRGGQGWKHGRVEGGGKDGRSENREEGGWAEPVYLVDEDGHRYELRFDCAACEMEVIW
jgi:putative protease